MDISQNIDLEVFNASEYVFRQGSQGDKFYILISGVLLGLLEPPNMLTNNAKILEQSKIIFRLEPGDHFGELALQNNASRSCSVQAEELSICAVLKKEAFLKIVGEEGIQRKFKEIEDFLLSTPNFKDCDIDDVKMLASKVSPLSVQSAKNLADQGERSLRMYILRSGNLSVKRKILKTEIVTDCLPGILKPYLKTVPDILEIEVMSKSTPGDVCLFYEIMADIESRYKVEVSIPSKLFHCSASDLYGIFKTRKYADLPFYEDAMTDCQVLVRRYLERQLWQDYSNAYFNSTYIALQKTGLNPQVRDLEPLEDKKAHQALEDKSHHLSKYLANRVQEINGELKDTKRFKRTETRIISRFKILKNNQIDLKQSSMLVLGRSSKLLLSNSEVDPSISTLQHVPSTIKTMPRMNSLSLHKKISTRRLANQEHKKTIGNLSGRGVDKIQPSLLNLLEMNSPRHLQIGKPKPVVKIKEDDEFVNRIVGQRAIDIIATANGRVKGTIPETDEDKRRMKESVKISKMAQEIDQICREKLPRPLAPLRTRMAGRDTASITKQRIHDQTEAKVKSLAIGRVLMSSRFEDEKERQKFLQYLKSSKNNFYSSQANIST